MKSYERLTFFTLYGVFLMLFVMAGLYKAAFPFLPDLTFVFGGLTFIWFLAKTLINGRADRAFLKALFFIVILSASVLFTTMININWTGYETKLARFLIINGWAFLGGAYLASNIDAVKGLIFILVILGVCFGIANSGASSALLFLKDTTNYLGISRIGAMGVAASLPFLLGDEKSAKKPLFLIVILFLSYSTFSSGGRGPSLGLLVVVLGYFAMRFFTQSKETPKVKILVWFLVLCGVIASLYYLGSFDYLLLRLQDFRENSAIGRIDRLEKGLELWKIAPLLGNGANAFPAYYNSFPTDSPHNLVVEIGAEFGFIPLFILSMGYLYIIIRLLVKVFFRPIASQNVNLYMSAVFLVLIFWLSQVGLMGIASGKYAAVFLGIGLGMIEKDEGRICQ